MSQVLIRNWWVFALRGALGFLMSMAVAEAQLPIPDASLGVTVQQKNNEGKVGPQFLVLRLSCWKGACALSTMSLNDCRPSADSAKPTFFPKVEYSTTSGKSLRIHREENTLVAQEIATDLEGRARQNLRFTYAPPEFGTIVSRLIGFSGEIVRVSAATQYVPLPKTYQVVRLNCDALLPGLSK